MMWVYIKVKITQIWCAVTGGHAVYVKDLAEKTVSVRVMRTKFDPFVDTPEKLVYVPKYGYRNCLDNGSVGNGHWQWRYVNQDLHVQHKLSH